MKLGRNEKGQAISIIEPQFVNHARVKEIVSSLVGCDGRIYPIPYSFIKDDTLDTLNLVMQALGLYTFPILELCEWLESQIDDDPEYEPYSAIEICGGTGWIGRQLGIPITDIKNMFSISAQGKSAKDKVDELLYQHGYCIESATITTIPIYYLQPNTRIHLFDQKTNLDGDYIISKITIPLAHNGTMQITATKAAERII